MDDQWFADKFTEIASRLSVIEEQVKETNGTVKIHEKKIRNIEDYHLVKQTEEKFHKKHPFITLSGISIGGVSLLTLIGLIIKVIIDMP